MIVNSEKENCIWRVTEYAFYNISIRSYVMYTQVYQPIFKLCCFALLSVALLDDLDKELNNYIMRCREWYGWHFPELGKIITDNLAFARVVKLMGKFPWYKAYQNDWNPMSCSASWHDYHLLLSYYSRWYTRNYIHSLYWAAYFTDYGCSCCSMTK